MRQQQSYYLKHKQVYVFPTGIFRSLNSAYLKHSLYLQLIQLFLLKNWRVRAGSFNQRCQKKNVLASVQINTMLDQSTVEVRNAQRWTAPGEAASLNTYFKGKDNNQLFWIYKGSTLHWFYRTPALTDCPWANRGIL